MDWMLAVTLLDCCTVIHQRESKPWKSSCSAQGVRRVVRVESPTALARTVFLPHSRTEPNTLREEQSLFNLFFATGPHEPQKEGSFDWEVADFKSSHEVCPTLDCTLQTKITLGLLASIWDLIKCKWRRNLVLHSTLAAFAFVHNMNICNQQLY